MIYILRNEIRLKSEYMLWLHLALMHISVTLPLKSAVNEEEREKERNGKRKQ